jgi:hypothetical protein
MMFLLLLTFWMMHKLLTSQQAHGDKLSSIANAKPISGLTQDLTRRNCGILAENRGTGWSQQYAATAACSQLLFTVEYASMNSQTAIGKGVVDKASGEGNESEITGATTLLGNASGMAAGTNGLVLSLIVVKKTFGVTFGSSLMA